VCRKGTNKAQIDLERQRVEFNLSSFSTWEVWCKKLVIVKTKVTVELSCKEIIPE